MERHTTCPEEGSLSDPSDWVGRHGDYLYRFALARVGKHHAAEEVVQEALLAALGARHRFRGASSERSWLTAILKRKITDWLRATVRARKRGEPLSDGLVMEDRLFTASGRWRAKPGEWSPEDPGREITREEFWATLRGCLDRLPERQRQAFVLQHLDDQPARRVRRAVGTSEGNLWVLLHRARLHLWRCLTVRWFSGEGNDKGGK